MTREHVIPKFLYRAMSTWGPGDGWNLAAMKRVAAEAVVKDVCGKCNSGALSALDAYGKAFLESAGLLVENYPRNTMALRYDHGLLLRWLLKLNYNSSRGIDQDAFILGAFRQYVLDGTSQLPIHISIVACLLRGESIQGLDPENHAFLKNLGSIDGKWRPLNVRISYLLLPDVFSPIKVRVCTFGCLSLFLVIDLTGQPKGHFRKFVKGLMTMWPNSVELIPGRDRFVLKESKRTWGEEYLPMLEIEEAALGE